MRAWPRSPWRRRACGSTSDVKSGGGSSGGSAGGSSVLTIQGDPGNPNLVEDFNPLVTATPVLRGWLLMYEPLEIRSPVDGTYTPYLATGHKFTNPTTLVYTLRQGVKWSDGKAFTAADVAFTYQLLKKFPALDSKGVWSQISAVKASGNQVTFTFKAANVPFAGVLGDVAILPQHIWSSIEDPTKYTNTKPVGTGPYTLEKFAPTQYTLKKNPDYWQAGKIVPTEVVFPPQSSNQNTNQLDVTSGKYDWSYNFLPNVKQTYVSRDKTHNIYWFPPGGAIGLFMNQTKAPYNNADFRRGVSYALNRTTIGTKAVNGYEAQASQSGLILPNLKRWLDPGLANQGNIAQNVSAAKQAFGRAGYTERGGKLVGKDGKPVTMTIELPINYTDWVAGAKEVSAQLGAMGIKVTLNEPQAAQYTQDTQTGNFDVAFGGFGGTGDPYTDFNNALNSKFAAPLKTATANNFERYKSPQVDQALATLASATKLSDQQAATRKLQQLMYQQVPVVQMYYGGSWGLFSTKNFTGWPSASDPYTLPTSYTDAVLTVLTHLKKS